MAAIRATNTKPELLVRRALHARGFRYRLHVDNIPGKPDLTLPKFNATVFVHGCFWHGHLCPLFRWPNTRKDFWREKIERNSIRDSEVQLRLHGAGWRVATIWECALKGRNRQPITDIIDSLVTWLHSNEERFLIEGRSAE